MILCYITTEVIIMTTGEKIRDIRTKKGIKQYELAEQAQISVNALINYEKNKRTPSLEVVCKIASALEIRPADLLSDKKYEYYDRYNLEQKLREIGYVIDGIGSEGYMWIVYPDGFLEVNDQQLEALNDATNEYLKLRLTELKKNNLKYFTPKK